LCATAIISFLLSLILDLTGIKKNKL